MTTWPDTPGFPAHQDAPDQDRSAASLRARLRALAQGSLRAAWPALAFGVPAIDAALPGGGLARGALHEVASGGADIEHGAAAALFVAGVLARANSTQANSTQANSTCGHVLWVGQCNDLFAPALAGVGLHPDRVIHAQADRPAAVLLAMEDALHHRGLLGVVGELSGAFTLTASRRLQLACEAIGVPAFVLRRTRRHDDPALAAPCAAVTRWRVHAVVSPPPLAHAPEVPGLARPRWRLDLIRCRGGDARSWIVEACDAQGRLDLPAGFSDRPDQARSPPRRADVGQSGRARRRRAVS